MIDVELPGPNDDEPQGDKTFSRIVALTVCAYAVALSITSLGGGNNGRDIMMDQQKASNKWAHYQAKAAREVLYRTEARELELHLLDRGPSMKQDVKEKTEALLADLHKEEKRMIGDKNEIMDEAKAYEAAIKHDSQREPFFDWGEVLLQVALVLASVAMLSDSLMAYVASLLSAFTGGLLSLNAFFLFFTLPEVAEKVSK